ncbi:MAG TPA: hypothetical protein VJ385_12480 [Fibrobacteria bacterium]|nr:hypothetical protein [Fibrobacteria bacterium]
MVDENENNLVQRREDRRTLEKMRRKLATSGHMGKNDVAKLKSNPKRGVRVWPFAIAAAVVLLGLNFALRTQQERIAGALGAENVGKAPLTPPANASPDEQALFWAYAVYDVPKLKARFRIPKGAVIDQAAARKNLDILLAENLGATVRNEIFVMQQKAPKETEGKKIGAVRKPAP